MAFLKIAAVAAVCAAGENPDDLNLLQSSIQREASSKVGEIGGIKADGIMLGCDYNNVKLQFGDDIFPALFRANPLKSKDGPPTPSLYAKELAKLDIKAVEKDLTDLMTANFDYWPNDADYNNYGPFFVRLAWHCSGPYRATDGKGGCSGGRLRFEPERSWPDNTNLDKARTLLAPIKMKYGDGLSWGDLMTAAGTIAIQSMGGPTKPFCFGRIDDRNGKKSIPLDQPCKDPDGKKLLNGKCVGPWGPTTVGLIYVNPEGPVDTNGDPRPDPSLSATDIQDSFGRMGMDAMEIVALIGGGHAFGKTHGACEGSPGNSPSTAGFLKSKNMGCIWNGTCGDGKGANTFTSGFEGPWTNTPTQWGNDFFKGLLEEKWEKHKGPGGHWQWRTANRTSVRKTNMRLTSDLALLHNPVYKALVEIFAKDQSALDNAFAHAWAQLTEAGGTWSTARKCQEIPINMNGKFGKPGPKDWAAWFPRPASAALPEVSFDTLQLGDTLAAGAELKSASGNARLSMQASDGNLVLYSNDKAVWSSKTTGHPGAVLCFQQNGRKYANLVLYKGSTASTGSTWASGNLGGGPVTLQLQDDCNLVMLDSKGKALWALGTTCGN